MLHSILKVDYSMEVRYEYSRRYYYGHKHHDFHTQNAAQRHAEWKLNAMRDFYGSQYVNGEIISGSDWYQVKVTLKKEN